MYNVSNDYIDAMHALTKTDRLMGTLTFKDGDTIDITESVIGERSVSISRACVDGDELNFGAAIMAELSISLRSDVSRYKFYGAKISLTHGLMLSNGSFEEVPLGVFTVGDAARVGKLVNLHAYDNLYAFDKPFGDTVVTGTPFYILKELCDLCGVEFGMDSKDFASLPNGTEVLQIDSTNGCKTFRDALKIIGQMLCGFVTADRTGKIKVSQFSKTVIATLTENDRYNTVVEDFNCNYTAVEITGLSGTYKAKTKEIREGLTLYMDDAPAWDYGLEEILQKRTDNVLTYIEDFNYTPCEISLPGNPIYDCGDRLIVSVNGELIETVIMEIEWQFRNKMKLISSGTNLFNLGSQDSSQRMTDRENATNKIEFYNYSNPDEFNVQDNEKVEICNIQLATITSTRLIFMASIVLDADIIQTNIFDSNTNMAVIDTDDNIIEVKSVSRKDGELVFEYMLNNLEEDYAPIYKIIDGKNTIVLMYCVDGLAAQSSYNWAVSVKPLGGTVKIKEWDARFTIFGQGIVSGDSAWDGRIEVEDTIDLVQIMNNLGHLPLDTSVEGSAIETDTDSCIEHLHIVPINNKINILGIDSTIVDNLVYEEDVISVNSFVSPDGFNAKYVESVDKFIHINEYYFEGESFEVEEGVAVRVDTDTSQFLRVDGMEVI